MRAISVICRAGRIEVPVEEVVGDFALHLSTGEGAPKWTVTHVPTGLAAVAVPRKRDARKIARYLRDNLPLPDGDPATVFQWVQERRLTAVSEFVFGFKGARRTMETGDTAELLEILEDQGASEMAEVTP